MAALCALSVVLFDQILCDQNTNVHLSHIVWSCIL